MTALVMTIDIGYITNNKQIANNNFASRGIQWLQFDNQVNTWLCTVARNPL